MKSVPNVMVSRFLLHIGQKCSNLLNLLHLRDLDRLRVRKGIKLISNIYHLHYILQ